MAFSLDVGRVLLHIHRQHLGGQSAFRMSELMKKNSPCKEIDPYGLAERKDFGRYHGAEPIALEPRCVPQSSLTWLGGERSPFPPPSSPPCRTVPVFCLLNAWPQCGRALVPASRASRACCSACLLAAFAFLPSSCYSLATIKCSSDLFVLSKLFI